MVRNARTEQEIREELDAIEIDVLEPVSRKEEIMAQALEEFSSFVLREQACQEILDKHMGLTVGALQGGSEQHEIYRVSITRDHDGAAAEWMRAFHASPQGKRFINVLTVDKLEHYMLGMCDRRSSRRGGRTYEKLGNLMFILAFGHADGQVRHIDSMTPNLQLCLYMSSDCPSTVVYATEGPKITNCKELLELWGKTFDVPALLTTILEEQAEVSLKDKWYTKYFSFWGTLDTNLECFGKLYQPVSRQLSLQCDPGTMLIAGGNEVHAGPRTLGPRMFAFAIGVPVEEAESSNDEDNNGEVQYTPVQVHVDLCCILFSMMDFEYIDRQDEHEEAKLFLLYLLLPFIDEYPEETYARLMGDDRSEVRGWIAELVEHAKVNDENRIRLLMQKAIASETMFYSPMDPKKRRAKKKRRNKNPARIKGC